VSWPQRAGEGLRTLQSVGWCLNELVIVEIRTIALQFSKSFFFSCCKIEFVQCGKNPWGLQSRSSPQEPEPEEYEVVLYIGAAPIYIYYRTRTMGTRYRQSSDPEPQKVYADLTNLPRRIRAASITSRRSITRAGECIGTEVLKKGIWKRIRRIYTKIPLLRLFVTLLYFVFIWSGIKRFYYSRIKEGR